MRKVQFVNSEYYHIYNRGIDKRQIFIDEEDYLKFLRGLRDFNNRSYYENRANIIRSHGIKELSSFLEKENKVVEIVAYCLNPNHFHLLLRQSEEKGISGFMHKVSTGFTNYFNKKYNRSGSLFQGPFKAVSVNTDSYILWLSAYINGNAEIHKIAGVEKYKWSSYPKFLEAGNDDNVSSAGIIISQFQGSSKSDEYKNFVKMVIKESRDKKDMEKYLLEEL